MMNLSKEDIENRFTINEYKRYNNELRCKYNALSLEHSRVLKQQEGIIKSQVELKTREIRKELKEKDKIIDEKNKEIEALKEKIVKMQMKLDTDSTNSGIPTSKTAIGKKKYIPNTREKTDKNIGGQKGHNKHQLKPFKEEEATEIFEYEASKCNKCHSINIEKLDTSILKEEIDYEVKIIKRINKFIEYKCNDCGNIFHVNIPNDLKEPVQYGKTVQSLAVCLTNEIYTPFNKTVKLVTGLTDGEINMSEGYVTKLQKRASNYLDEFIEKLKEYISKQDVYGWDDGVVTINKKDGILRTYCTDNVALFIGHEKKNEDGIEEDGILKNTSEKTIVMHDHILHNYNEKYNFENVECLIHLIRRLKKKSKETEHEWCDELINLLSNTNKERNELLKQNKNKFDDNYLNNLSNSYDEILKKGKAENEDTTKINYYKDEEERFIKDLNKYKKNYLLWAYRFDIPSTNNNSERNIRPVKSKMKISGQFQNINYLKYYANIRSYIETCKKNNINIIDACVQLMNGEPYTLDYILKHEKNSV